MRDPGLPPIESFGSLRPPVTASAVFTFWVVWLPFVERIQILVHARVAVYTQRSLDLLRTATYCTARHAGVLLLGRSFPVNRSYSYDGSTAKPTTASLLPIVRRGCIPNGRRIVIMHEASGRGTLHAIRNVKDDRCHDEYEPSVGYWIRYRSRCTKRVRSGRETSSETRAESTGPSGYTGKARGNDTCPHQTCGQACSTRQTNKR